MGYEVDGCMVIVLEVGLRKASFERNQVYMGEYPPECRWVFGPESVLSITRSLSDFVNQQYCQ